MRQCLDICINRLCIVFLFLFIFLLLSVFIRTFCLYALSPSTSFYADNKLLSLSLHKRTIYVMDKGKKNTMRPIYKKGNVAIHR